MCLPTTAISIEEFADCIARCAEKLRDMNSQPSAGDVLNVINPTQREPILGGFPILTTHIHPFLVATSDRGVESVRTLLDLWVVFLALKGPFWFGFKKPVQLSCCFANMLFASVQHPLNSFCRPPTGKKSTRFFCYWTGCSQLGIRVSKND